MELQKINCPSCKKLLCEANGEIKKVCPRCKTVVHVVTTSKGVIELKRDTIIVIGQ
jgi:phage FluMu protein Com